MANKLVVKYRGRQLTTFDSNDKIQDLIDYLDVANNNERRNFEFVPESLNEVKESIVNDSENEWTIWSSTDFSESDEQIPLVKIVTNAEGELEAVAVGDDPFDRESLTIAQNSLKSSQGKPTKDRILRVDKSLNHSDPFFSTELQRGNIRADRGRKDKKPIEQVIGAKPQDVPYTKTDIKADKYSDKVITDDIKDLTYSDVKSQFDDTISLSGLSTLASQVLLTNRDDLKALANLGSATEQKLVDLYNEITGVDYYTEKIVDNDQYNYILDLLGRSPDKYDDTYVSPKDNIYVQNLKDLTEDLIEKVNLKKDPGYYSLDGIRKSIKDELLEVSNKENVTEDEILNTFTKLTGVDYNTDSIVDTDIYNMLADKLGIERNTEVANNAFIQNLKDLVETLI